MRAWRGLLLGALIMALALTAHDASAGEKAAALNSYAVSSWGIRDGLPSNVIWSIVQDRDGYLWLGTDGGLVRFDGGRFIVVSSIGQVALPKARVVALHITRDGSMWVGFNGGVSRIDHGHVVNYAESEGLPASIVRGIVEDSSGIVYVGNGSGLFQLSGNRWTRLDASHGLPAGAVDALYMTRGGDLIVGATTGVYRRPPGTESFQLVDAVEGGGASLRRFSEDLSGEMWTTDSQLGFRRLGEPRATRTSRRVRGSQLLHDSTGNLWVGTTGEELWRVGEPMSHPLAIETTRVLGARSIYEDRDGNIWCGSSEGLIRLKRPRVTPITGLGSISGLQATTSGEIWASSGNELIRLSPTTEGQKPGRIRVDGGEITGLAADKAGNLWTVTPSRVARVSGRQLVYFSPGSGRPLARMNAIAVDAHEGLWISDSERGLFRWTAGPAAALEPVDLPNGLRIAAMSADDSGRLWFSSTNGLLGSVDTQGTLRTYGSGDGLRSGPYLGVYQDRSQTVWIGDGDGLARLSDGLFVRISDDSGFRGFVTGIIEDETGDLWLATFAGIACVRRNEIKQPAGGTASARFSFYDATDGAAGVPAGIGRMGIARAADGTLWFATSRGVTVVNPSTLKNDRAPTPVTLEEVTADDATIDTRLRTELSPWTNRLQISYSAIELTSVEKVRFRYRLDGLDASWIEAGRQRSAIYTHLPARSYRFVVQATNHDGSWSEPGTVWEFSIPPAFYQTAWFGAVCVASLTLIGWGAWRSHMRRVRQQFALVLGERVRLSRELHDTLLQSLVGVAVQVGAVAEALDASSPARQQISRIRESVEEYIRDARQSIWNLRAPILSSHNLSASLRMIGERAIDDRPVTLEVSTVGEPVRYSSDVEEQLLRIGQEAILNAALHSKAKRIGVSLHYSDASLLLRVCDNGCGFDVAHALASASGHYGLLTMRERAEAAGGRLEIHSDSLGTCLEVVVPRTTGELD